MEKPEFIIVPPMARIPQIPPQQVAGNRRVYIAPTFNPLSTSQYSPAPRQQTPKPNVFLHMAPTLTRIPIPQQQQSPARSWQRYHVHPEENDVVIALPPLIRLSSHPPKVPGEWKGLDTPRPLSPVQRATQLSPIGGMQRDVFTGSSQSRGIPDTPPYSIPGYFPVRADRQEPGVGETLMGCAVLLIVSIVVLIFLYYISS
jgi:hypothetical protein